jgi:hypothetical protein
MSLSIPALRSPNTRAVLLILVAIALALSFSLGAVSLHTGAMVTGASGLAAHVSYFLHVPYVLAFDAVELLVTGGAIAACLAFVFICPVIAWVDTLIAQLGIAGAALA